MKAKSEVVGLRDVAVTHGWISHQQWAIVAYVGVGCNELQKELALHIRAKLHRIHLDGQCVR